MPWQQAAADVAGEVDADGKLCYRKVVITVPRQCGKTTLILSVVAGRAENGARFGGRQTMLYAAQTREDARGKLVDEYMPLVTGAKALRGRVRTRVSNGSERITWLDSGSTFGTVATKEKSGHGKVIDFGCIDEAFAQETDAVEMAWKPAMITRPMAQLWMPSTAGGPEHVWFREQVEDGRRAVEIDEGFGTCYIEYSAPSEAEEPDLDPFDEDLWWRTIPALGYTQPIEAVRSTSREVKLATWKRAHLNIWLAQSGELVFAADRWKACRRPDAVRATRPVLAVDVAADRSHAVIVMAAADASNRTLCRVIEYHEGTDWVVPKLQELCQQYDVAKIIMDTVGPVRSLVTEAENAYLNLHPMTTGEMVGACGLLYDAIKRTSVSHFGESELEAAVRGAARRKLGDAWAWTRSTSAEQSKVDISPLVALTAAHWGQLKFGDQAGHSLKGSFG
jgi:hypothetical protein